jgi:hypothetical protein
MAVEQDDAFHHAVEQGLSFRLGLIFEFVLALNGGVQLAAKFPREFIGDMDFAPKDGAEQGQNDEQNNNQVLPDSFGYSEKDIHILSTKR